MQNLELVVILHETFVETLGGAEQKLPPFEFQNRTSALYGFQNFGPGYFNLDHVVEIAPVFLARFHTGSFRFRFDHRLQQGFEPDFLRCQQRYHAAFVSELIVLIGVGFLLQIPARNSKWDRQWLVLSSLVVAGNYLRYLV